MPSWYVRNLDPQNERDVEDVLHRLGAVGPDIYQYTLQYIVEVMAIFQSNLEIQRLCVQVLFHAAVLNRESTPSTISREDVINTGAARLVLLARHKFPDDPDLTLACAGLFSCMALNDECKGPLMECGTVEMLIQVLDLNRERKEVVNQALQCVRHLATIPGHCPVLQAKGLIALCLKVGERYLSDKETCSILHHCLWNFVSDDATMECVVQQGALALTAPAMKKHAWEPAVLGPATGLLMSVARVEHLRGRVMEARGLKFLLDSMYHFPRNADVFPNAVGGLTLLGQTLEYRIKLLNLGAGAILQVMAQLLEDVESQLLLTGLVVVLTADICPAMAVILNPAPGEKVSIFDLVCKLMHLYPDHRDLMHQCMGILLHISVAPQYLPEIHHKASDRILSVARRFPDDGPIVSKCNHLLAELSTDEGLLKGLLQAGIIGDVVNGMRQFATVSSHLMGGACHLITVLAITEENRAELIAGGAVEMVLDAMKVFVQDVPFLTQAAAALWRLAHERLGKEHIFNAGGMEILKGCMDGWPKEGLLWRNANGVLRSLITEEAYTKAFLETFGGDLHDESDYAVYPIGVGTFSPSKTSGPAHIGGGLTVAS